MSTKQEKAFFIPSFPLDNQEYIITNWGLLRKNPSPEASVFLAEVSLESLNGSNKFTTEIIFTHLFVARMGSVWKNQKPVHNYYCKKRKGFKSKTLSFSFSSATPPLTKLVISNKTSKLGSKSIIDIDKLDQEQHNVISVFTVFTTADGMEVFIPSLEILLSTYAPNTHTVLHDISIMPIDNVIEKHLSDWYISREDEDVYYIDTVGNYHISTKFLLAYLSCNDQTRINVSKIRSSLINNQLTQNGLKYSFMEVSPYHPNDFNIEATGLYDKQNNRFWVHQIRSYDLPSEHIIAYEDNDTENDQEKTARRKLNNENVVTDEIPLIDDVDAGRHAGKSYVKSEITANIPPDKVRKVKNIKKKLEALTGKVKPHKAEAASASPLSDQNASKPVAAIEHKDIDKENHLKILLDAIKSLNEQICFLSDDADRHSEVVFCDLKRKKTFDGRRSNWAFISKGRPRRLLVCEIYLSDKFVYILDIERKNKDAYAGIIFSLTEKMDASLLRRIKDVISVNQGRFGGDKKRRKFPVGIYKAFRHYSEKIKMENSIHSLIETF